MLFFFVFHPMKMYPSLNSPPFRLSTKSIKAILHLTSVAVPPFVQLASVCGRMVHQMMLMIQRMTKMVQVVGGCYRGRSSRLIPIVGRMMMMMMLSVQQWMSIVMVRMYDHRRIGGILMRMMVMMGGRLGNICGTVWGGGRHAGDR